MSLFTPLKGIIGGSLIGGSAGVLLVLNGDIMGFSGIINNALVTPVQSIQRPQNHWRYVYLASFCLSVNVFVNYFAPDTFLEDERSSANDVPIPSAIAYMLGGFFVGAGTKLANGCTSGHGICGMSRLSKRSLFATGIFTFSAIFTRYLISPLRSWSSSFGFLRGVSFPTVSPIGSGLVMASTVLVAMISPALSAKNRAKDGSSEDDDRKLPGAALSGVMSAAGLAISGMIKNSKVHDFLCLSGLSQGSFDPTLMTVLGSGILSSWLSYQFVKSFSLVPDKALSSPLCLGAESKFSVPTNTNVDAELIGGAAIFGLGWGLTGICPGPGMFAAASGNVSAITLWLPMYMVGSYTGQKIKDNLQVKPKST